MRPFLSSLSGPPRIHQCLYVLNVTYKKQQIVSRECAVSPAGGDSSKVQKSLQNVKLLGDQRKLDSTENRRRPGASWGV